MPPASDQAVRDIVAQLVARQDAPAGPAMGSLVAPASERAPAPNQMAALVQGARDQLASQPARLAPAPMSEADQAAMSPETFANPAVRSVMGSIATLPQRAIENSQYSLDSGTYDPGPTLEAATLPMGTGAIAGVPVRAGEAVLGAGPIRAYHGSPHDFDAFSMDKIGTGEGAQAYGHGLYFAENEGVAKGYRDALAPQSIDGKMVEDLLAKHGGDKSSALADIASQEAGVNNPKYAGMFQGARDMIEGKTPTRPGKMYEVNINADPEHFLDWDKPLSEQHPEVAKALDQVVKSRDRLPAEWINSSPGAEQRMRDAGIPGIKYLDQGSRAAGDGSRNYVVFNDKLIDIARKYGMGSLAALPPATLAALSGNSPDQTQ